jgi:hypothetical protein
MNSFHTIRRFAAILTGLMVALLALWAGAAPAALASALGGAPHGRPGLASPRPEPPGWDKHPPLPTHAHALVAAARSAGRSLSSRPGPRCSAPRWQ